MAAYSSDGGLQWSVPAETPVSAESGQCGRGFFFVRLVRFIRQGLARPRSVAILDDHHQYSTVAGSG
jgi:hypothetical protein